MNSDDLLYYKGPDEVVSAREIQEAVSEEDNGQVIFSGISVLDETLDSFRLGEIVVLSGPPGHGKTSFARFLLTKFSGYGYKCLYFGKEGGVNNFFKKFPDPLPGFYMSKAYIESSLQWLEERMVEGKLKYGCNIAFVDHLHYILDMAQMTEKNTSVYIGQFMRQLVDLARKHKVLIFLLAHTNKEVFSRAPNLSDIRDSSFIAQEADTVMFIWRRQKIDNATGETEFFENQGKLSIQKNRRQGIHKTIKLIYDNGTFREGNYAD